MNELTKKPATILRTYTQQVRDHTAHMERLKDQYFAGLKRLEAAYFEGVRKIADAIAEDTVATSTEESAPASDGNAASVSPQA